MIRAAKFDLDALRAASVEARKRVEQWPAWKRELVGYVYSRATTNHSAGELHDASAGCSAINPAAGRLSPRESDPVSSRED